MRFSATKMDPAIDQEKTTADIATRYYTTRDAKCIPLLDGKHPVLFTIQRPSALWLAEVVSAIGHMNARRYIAFRGCVHRVHQDGKSLLEAVHPDRASKEEKYVLTKGTAGAMLSPESFIEAVARKFGHESILEMGQIALDFAELTEENTGPFGPWGGSVARPSSLL